MAAMRQPKGPAKKIADRILGKKVDKKDVRKQPEPQTTAEQSFEQLKSWRRP